MEPEPLLWVPADVFLDAIHDLLGGAADVLALVLGLFHAYRLADYHHMRAVGAPVEEHRDDGDVLVAGHGGRAGNAVRGLSEKIQQYAVVRVCVLIHDQPDEPAIRQHGKHLPNPGLVGDVHPDESAVLVDEAIHAGGLLLHGDTHEGNADLGECPAQELPVPAVGRGEYGSPTGGSRLLEPLPALDGDIAFYLLFQHGEPEHLEQHGAESHGAGAGDAPRLVFACAEAAHDVLGRQILSFPWDEVPGERGEASPHQLAERRRQQARDPARQYRKVVRHAQPPVHLILLFHDYIVHIAKIALRSRASRLRVAALLCSRLPSLHNYITLFLPWTEKKYLTKTPEVDRIVFVSRWCDHAASGIAEVAQW